MAFLLAAPAAVDPATRAIDHKEACETLCPELVITAGGTQISVNGFCDTCSGHDCNGPMRPDCCHKLGYGDGDCDSDDDCLPGLFCGHNNCAEFRVSAGWPEESERGWDTTDDCCFAVRDGGFGGGVFFGMFLGALLLWMSTVAYKRGYCAGLCRALAPVVKRLPRTLQPAAAATAAPTSTGGLNAPADRYASFTDVVSPPLQARPIGA
jgi:hypothetical protein